MGFKRIIEVATTRVCGHCKSKLIMKMLLQEDYQDFRKTAPTILCPICDEPSPPRPLGSDPS